MISEEMKKLINAAADEHYNSSMDSPSEALLVAAIEKLEADLEAHKRELDRALSQNLQHLQFLEKTNLLNDFNIWEEQCQ